jgi:hypothetical protein
MGFRRALVPPSAPAPPEGIEVIRVRNVVEAARAAGVSAPVRVAEVA